MPPPSIPRDPAFVDEADVRALVRLFASAATLPDRARRTEVILAGLCALVGADGWSREADSLACGQGEPRDAPGITLHREGCVPPFSPRELQLADIVLSEAPWLLNRDSSPGQEGSAGRELPPRQRQALELLLAGCSRKDLADRMNVSLHTAADYAKGLYKHFGVRSQRELMGRSLLNLALALPSFLAARGDAGEWFLS